MKKCKLKAYAALILLQLAVATARSSAPSTQRAKGALGPRVLAAAIVVGKVARVRSLIEAGADVNGRDDDESPLDKAAELGQTEIARLLIEKKADVRRARPDRPHAAPSRQAVPRDRESIDRSGGGCRCHGRRW